PPIPPLPPYTTLCRSRAFGVEDLRGRERRIRAVRGHDRSVRVLELGAYLLPHIAKPLEQHELRIRTRMPIAVIRVIRHVPFEEHDDVAEAREPLGEPPPERCVAVAPRGADRETEYDDLHEANRSLTAIARKCASSSSTVVIEAGSIVSRS